MFFYITLYLEDILTSMAASNPQQMISMPIANSVGGPTRAPLLVVEEYDH